MPTFTNNTTYGTLSSTSIHSSHNIWNAFDGVIGGTNKYLSTNTSAGDITWNAPHYVSINSCKFYQTDIITRFPRSIRILGDGIEIANVSGYSQPASGAYLEVICNKKVYKQVQWIFGNNFGGDAGVAVSEIVLDIDKGYAITI